MKYSEEKKKSCNFVPIVTRCSNIWALTSWYTVDSDPAWLTFALKSARFLPDAATLMIVFRINWLCVHQVLHVHWICSSHSNHVWPEANPRAASVHCLQQCFVVSVWAAIVHDILIGPYLLPRWLNAQIYWLFLEEKLPETGGSSTMGVRFTLHVRSDNILPPPTTITSL
jgi:hypothetical protein